MGVCETAGRGARRLFLYCLAVVIVSLILRSELWAEEREVLIPVPDKAEVELTLENDEGIACQISAEVFDSKRQSLGKVRGRTRFNAFGSRVFHIALSREGCNHAALGIVITEYDSLQGRLNAVSDVFRRLNIGTTTARF